MQHLNKKNEKLGQYGEEIACKYLLNNQYVILHRNWRHKHLEVDIIAQRNSVLHIIEVKTRTSTTFERPQDSVTIKKQKFLVSAANAYIEKYTIDVSVQFDIIHIIYNNQNPIITFLEDAFYPSCS